jgi:hypothetical protein
VILTGKTEVCGRKSVPDPFRPPQNLTWADMWSNPAFVMKSRQQTARPNTLMAGSYNRGVDSMKFSRAISRVNILKCSNVIFRVLASNCSPVFIWLGLARENFIQFSRRENIKTYIEEQSVYWAVRTQSLNIIQVNSRFAVLLCSTIIRRTINDNYNTPVTQTAPIIVTMPLSYTRLRS